MNECKDAKDGDAADESKRCTDVDTDKKSTHAVWKKPENKPSRICLCELADYDGHNHDKRVMAGKCKLLTLSTHLKATRFLENNDGAVGVSGPGDRVPDEGSNPSETSSKKRAEKLYLPMSK